MAQLSIVGGLEHQNGLVDRDPCFATRSSIAQGTSPLSGRGFGASEDKYLVICLLPGTEL
jgi:hypothetical protein